MKSPSSSERRDCLYSNPILEEFFEVLVDQTGAERCLYVAMDGYENFTVSPDVETVDPRSLSEWWIDNHKEIDLLILDLPLGWHDKSGQYNRNEKLSISLDVLSMLSDNGLALFATVPNGLGQKAQRFQNDLQKLGWYVLGYLEMPENGLNVGFQPQMAILSKANYEGLYISSVADYPSECTVALSLTMDDPKDWEEDGFLEKSSDFSGFRLERIRRELKSLLKAESGFELYRFGDFVTQTSSVRRNQTVRPGEDEVLIPRTIGRKSANVAADDDTPNSLIDWISVSLSDRIEPQYLKMFLNSELGRMCLETVSNGTIVPAVCAKDLLEMMIPVPSLDTQQSLLSTYENLEKLQNQISLLEKELVFNPKNVDTVSDDVVSLLGSIGRLTNADQIKSLIRSGENKTTEFKETLSWDVRKEEKAKYVEQSALKTVAGFLNTDGGTLLIGVHDNGEIPGVDLEIGKLYKGETDKFLLHFKNLMKSKLGEKFYPKIDWSVENVDGRKVLVVKTERGSEPAYIDDVFYVRTNPATDQLQGERLFKYLIQRFKTDFE